MQLKINNLNINFEVIGTGEQDLVIIHGWGDCLDSFRKVAESLSDLCKCYLIDLPGFGKSDKPPQNFTSKDISEIVLEFITNMDLKKPMIMGHSWGGKVAIILASKNPEISKLILVASSGVDIQTLKTKIKIKIFKWGKIILSHFGSLGNEIYKKFLSKLGSLDYRNTKELKQVFKNVIQEHVFSEALKVKSETLIIWGDKDKILPVKQALVLKNLIQHSFIRVVWGAGHHPHRDNFSDFIKIVRDFINDS